MRLILLQALLDDEVQRGRDVPSGVRKIGRLLLQDRQHRVGGRVPLERLPARDQLVEDMLPWGWLGPHPGWGEARQSLLTHDEQRTEFTLWAIARSPLILGAN